MSELSIIDKGINVPIGQLQILLNKQQVVFGNFERDLILRTSGNIKIQIGNKFYDLPIATDTGGNVGTKTTLIINNLSGFVYPGDAYFVYTTDNSTLYITINGQYVPITQGDVDNNPGIQKVYLSYEETQNLSGLQKDIVLRNTGLLLNNFSSIVSLTPDTVYENQLIYTKDTRRFYGLNNIAGPNDYTSWDPLFVNRSGDTITGNIYIESKNDIGNATNVSLHIASDSSLYGLGTGTEQFNGLFIGSKTLSSGLAIYDTLESASYISAQGSTIKFLTNGGTSPFNPLSLYEDTVGINGLAPFGSNLSVNGNTYLNGSTTVTNTIKSDDYISGTTGSGFSIYEDANKWYLEIDYLKLRSSSEFTGDVNDTKPVNGSLTLDFGLILKNVSLYETIDIFTRSQVSAKFKDTSGTIVPWIERGTRVNAIYTSISSLLSIEDGSNPAPATYQPIDVIFGIGDMDSSSNPITGTTYIRDSSLTYKTIIPDSHYDSGSNTFITDGTGNLINSGIIYVYNIGTDLNVTVGDLYYYKRWDKNKVSSKQTTVLVEIVKKFNTDFYVYSYDNPLTEGVTLVKVGNRYSDIQGVQLNSADSLYGFIQGFKGVRNFNQMINEYYVDEIGDGSNTYIPDLLIIDPKIPTNNVSYTLEGTKITFGNQLTYENNVLTIAGLEGISGRSITGSNGLNGGGLLSAGDIVISHNAKAWVDKFNLTDGDVISNLTIDAYGHPTDWTTRSLDSRYLQLAGGQMTGNIIYVDANISDGIYWAANTDYAKIFFESTSDAAGDSNLVFQNGDNGVVSGQGLTEGFIFRKDETSDPGGGVSDLFVINLAGLKYKGANVYNGSTGIIDHPTKITLMIGGVEIGKVDSTGIKLKAGKTFDATGY